MTTRKKRKVLIRIQQLENDIENLKEARADLASNAVQSATISSGGGSKSFTKMDLTKMSETIHLLTEELEQLKKMLKGASKAMPTQIVSIYF